jgi:ribonuclease HI
VTNAPAREPVTIFCDGSCLGNPGPGGWAALLVVERDRDGEKRRTEKLLVGNEKMTTNNRMELTAAMRGLQALTRPCDVLVVTDSNYVIKGMTEWRFGWQKRGWKNSQNKPVENRDLWEELIAAGARHDLKWQWVRGHAGHPENERVDAAAQAEAQKLRS